MDRRPPLLEQAQDQNQRAIRGLDREILGEILEEFLCGYVMMMWLVVIKNQGLLLVVGLGEKLAFF